MTSNFIIHTSHGCSSESIEVYAHIAQTRLICAIETAGVTLQGSPSDMRAIAAAAIKAAEEGEALLSANSEGK